MYVPPPTRRRWGPKIVAFAVSFLVLSLATTSAVAVAMLRKHASRTPATSVVRGADADTERRGFDEQVPAPSTPEASAAARPPWAHVGYAPQSTRAMAIYGEAVPMSEAIDRGFVICHFESFGHADLLAGDDLRVNAVFGSAPELTVNGPEDANSAFVSAPVVTLKPGDGLRFEVFDRDVFGQTLLSRTHPKFGWPLAAADQGASYDCRTLAPEAHARLVKTYAAAADGWLVALRQRHLDPTSGTWAYPERDVDHAELATSDIAALTGWADARTAKRVGKVLAEEARLQDEKAVVFGKLHEDAADHATVGTLDVKVAGIDCEGDACITHLAVTNRTDAEQALSSFFRPNVYVATPATGPIDATYPATKLGPHQTTTLDVASKGASLMKEKALVGVCADHGCVALRVH